MHSSHTIAATWLKVTQLPLMRVILMPLHYSNFLMLHLSWSLSEETEHTGTAGSFVHVQNNWKQVYNSDRFLLYYQADLWCVSFVTDLNVCVCVCLSSWQTWTHPLSLPSFGLIQGHTTAWLEQTCHTLSCGMRAGSWVPCVLAGTMKVVRGQVRQTSTSTFTQYDLFS